MNKILTENEIKKFKEDGAIFLKNKFDINWINKLKTGIEKDISNPSPRTRIRNILFYTCLKFINPINIEFVF